jgi:hypothetical protein
MSAEQIWVCFSARQLDGCTGPKTGSLREAHRDCGWKIIIDADSWRARSDFDVLPRQEAPR